MEDAVVSVAPMGLNGVLVGEKDNLVTDSGYYSQMCFLMPVLNHMIMANQIFSRRVNSEEES